MSSVESDESGDDPHSSHVPDGTPVRHHELEGEPQDDPHSSHMPDGTPVRHHELEGEPQDDPHSPHMPGGTPVPHHKLEGEPQISAVRFKSTISARHGELPDRWETIRLTFLRAKGDCTFGTIYLGKLHNTGETVAIKSFWYVRRLIPRS